MGNVGNGLLAEPVVGFVKVVGVGIASSVVCAGNRIKELFMDPVVQLFSLHISTSRAYSTIWQAN